MTTDGERRGQSDIVVLGATSLVGRHIVRRLAERGCTGLCLSRRADAADALPPGFAWRALGAGRDLPVRTSTILYSLVPIIELPALMSRAAGANRLITLSSASAVHKADSSDASERRLAQDLQAAEYEVQRLCERKGITWTIFRPTLIYDPGRDRNVSAIAAFVRRFRVFPIVWPGTGRRQPIHAEDVARTMIAAMDRPAAQGRLLGLPGGETLTYREMVRRVFQALERRPVLLYLTPGLARPALFFWQTVSGTTYSAASLDRMNKDLILDPAPLRDTLGITCRPFRPVFTDQHGARQA